jgi:hypothetical protein
LLLRRSVVHTTRFCLMSQWKAKLHAPSAPKKLREYVLLVRRPYAKPVSFPLHVVVVMPSPCATNARNPTQRDAISVIRSSVTLATARLAVIAR